MVSGRTRLWLRDSRVCVLPKISTAAVIPFNVPRTAENDAWLVKREKLIDSWTGLNMYDPDKTWGDAASEADKVTMVILDTSNTHTHTHSFVCALRCLFVCALRYLPQHVSVLCRCFHFSVGVLFPCVDVFILVSVFYSRVSMFCL